MNDILNDLTPSSLAIAIEWNMSSWIPVFGRTGRVVTDDPPGVNRSVSQVPFPLFNSIMDTRLEPENVNAAIERVKADAEARRVPVLWWVGPSTRPQDLGKRLEQSGFALDDDGPGMAVELAKLNERGAMMADLSIQATLDDRSMEEWCAAMAAGFEIPASRSAELADAWLNLIKIVDPATTLAFLARWRGKAVATSLLQIGAGVAGIYAVATIPEARRRGIGAKVILAPLFHARSLGYKAGILQSSPMGFSVYRSLGFQTYCRLCSYIYRPK